MQFKNIPKYQISVYEIDCENYFKDNPTSFNSNINLEGIVPSEVFQGESTVKDNQNNSLIKFTQKIEFKSIQAKEKGIFIVEILGNGVVSRAVIRKGLLSVLKEITIAGHLLTIIDENLKVCKPSSNNSTSTGIWINNRFNKAN